MSLLIHCVHEFYSKHRINELYHVKFYVSGLLQVHSDASGRSISGMNFLCNGLKANFGSPAFFSHIGIRVPCLRISVDFVTTSSCEILRMGKSFNFRQRRYVV